MRRVHRKACEDLDRVSSLEWLHGLKVRKPALGVDNDSISALPLPPYSLISWFKDTDPPIFDHLIKLRSRFPYEVSIQEDSPSQKEIIVLSFG
jgi:hypothetical protein